jgi:chromosome segregation ATPase
MAEEHISEYIDRDGIKGDTDFMLQEINRLYESFKKLDAYKFDLNGAKTFSVAGEAVKKLKIEMDELQRIEQSLIKTYEKRQAQTSNQAKDLVAERELLRQKNLELKNTVKESLAAENSIEKMRAQLSLLDQKKIKLNIDSEEYKKAEREALELTNKLKALEAASGDHRRNVGNYSGAIKTLEKALGEVRGKMDEFTRSGKISQATLEALTREEALLTQLVSNSANGFASATAELKNNERALQSLSAAGLQSTDFYKELLSETAKLKDNVGDLKAEIKNLASDTSTLDGLVQGATVLAGTYGIAQGAAALFGEENEELQKTFVKLQAIQTVINGLQSIQNALQKESSLILLLTTIRTKAAAAAQTLFAYATTGATVAARAFRIAMLLTGVGAVVVLLGAAAQAMGVFGSDTEEATENLDGFNESLKFSQELLESMNKSLDFQGKIAIEKAKQRGASDKELHDLEIKLLREKKKANADEISNLTDKYANISLKDKNYAAKQMKILDEIDARKAAAQDYDREITLKGEEFKTKQGEKSLDAQKKRGEKAKEYSERELRAQFELQKLYQEQKINAFSEVADAEGASLITRSAARLNQFEAERTLALAERDFLLENEKLTAS